MRTKKVILLVFLMAVSSSFLKGQGIDTLIQIRGKWQKGSSKNFTIVRCRTKTNGKDGQFFDQCSTTSVKVTLLDSTSKGYNIGWHYNDITLTDSYSSIDPVTKYIKMLTKGMTIKFSTDTSGLFQQILNWDDITMFMTARADSMPQALGNSDVVNSIRGKLTELIGAREQLQNVLLQDIQLYFSLYGYTLNKGIALGYSSFLPNLIGGDPFPSNGEIKLTSINNTNSTYEVTWHQEADSVKEKAIIAKFLLQESALQGKPAPKPEDIPAIRIYDDYYFLFDMTTGWTKKLNYKRTTATDKMKQVDSVDFLVN